MRPPWFTGLGIKTPLVSRFKELARARLLGLLRRMDARTCRWRRSLLPAEMVAFEDVTAPWFSSALGTVVLLGVPKLVSRTEPATLPALSADVGVDADSLKRLLDVVAAHGYFRFLSCGQAIRHTRLSWALMETKVGKFCELQSLRWYKDCFAPECVVAALKSGRIPFEKNLESEGLKPFFKVAQEEPEKGRLFADAMAEITTFCLPLLAASLSFESAECVLDVGGGNGKLCGLLMERFPHCSFTAFDLHPAESSSVPHQQGDFLHAVPTGFDHLLLKNILHDWSDEVVLTILGNCAVATEAGASLTMIELILPETTKASAGAAGDFRVDWNVFCTLGGKERRLSEYRALLARTGWELVSARPTALPLWVLQARRRE
jgi:O-methyltransferase domain